MMFLKVPSAGSATTPAESKSTKGRRPTTQKKNNKRQGKENVFGEHI